MRRPQRGAELLDGLIVVFLVGMFSGIGLAFVVRANQTIVPQVLRAATSAALGVLSGLTARRALRGRRGVLRAAAALAALGVALYFLGWFSGERAGLALPRAALPAPDWEGLLQILLGAFSALVALRAWPGPTAQSQVAARARELAGAASPRPQVSRKRTTGARRPRVAAAGRAVKRDASSAPARPRLRTRLTSWVSQRSVLARRGRRVRLVGAEEHRCPYCLEPVDGRDPRGVVVCRVCHTRHHGDCWAVTGECQVPHYHR
jgi:ribosomal protein L37AE/L43A